MMIREALEATALVAALVGAVHVMNVPLLISWPVVVLSHHQIHQAHCTGSSPKWLYSCYILHPICEDSLDPLNNDPCRDTLKIRVCTDWWVLKYTYLYPYFYS
jgi:hypothetical protein